MLFLLRCWSEFGRRRGRLPTQELPCCRNRVGTSPHLDSDPAGWIPAAKTDTATRGRRLWLRNATARSNGRSRSTPPGKVHRPRAGCHPMAHTGLMSARHPCRFPARWSRLWWHTRRGKCRRSCEWTSDPLLQLRVAGRLPQDHNINPHNAIPTALPTRYRVPPTSRACRHGSPLGKIFKCLANHILHPCAAAPDFSIFFSVSLTSGSRYPRLTRADNASS